MDESGALCDDICAVLRARSSPLEALITLEFADAEQIRTLYRSVLAPRWGARDFARRYDINPSNFSQWVNGAKGSPAAVHVVRQVVRERLQLLVSRSASDPPALPQHNPAPKTSVWKLGASFEPKARTQQPQSSRPPPTELHTTPSARVLAPAHHQGGVDLVTQCTGAAAIVFLDADNAPFSVDQLDLALASGNSHVKVVAVSTIRCRYHTMERHKHQDWLIDIQSYTARKNAADTALSFHCGLLDGLLPREVVFCVATRDGYGGELVLQPAARRACYAVDPHEVGHLGLWLILLLAGCRPKAILPLQPLAARMLGWISKQDDVHTGFQRVLQFIPTDVMKHASSALGLEQLLRMPPGEPLDLTAQFKRHWKSDICDFCVHYGNLDEDKFKLWLEGAELYVEAETAVTTFLWEKGKQTSTNWALTDLYEKSPEYTKVVAKVHETLPLVRVVLVQRVYNRILQTKFNKLKAKNRDAAIERELFHGSSETPPAKIYAGDLGFTAKLTPGEKGIVFTAAASGSHRFAYELTDRRRQMFLANVLMDCEECPPAKCCAGDGSEAYEVHNGTGALPEFLITYQVE
eukprot:TRINITY_DN18419_c0_g1_i1.p1 TRINITY_DN18419_c0_g1~~TRINITY_DN18419_c0_g1_i1.p1  ORF type:complete len:579 (+),score=84.21 TRINITY_DN18419_c0_g1_i1:3-1739(+)